MVTPNEAKFILEVGGNLDMFDGGEEKKGLGKMTYVHKRAAPHEIEHGHPPFPFDATVKVKDNEVVIQGDTEAHGEGIPISIVLRREYVEIKKVK